MLRLSIAPGRPPDFNHLLIAGKASPAYPGGFLPKVKNFRDLQARPVSLTRGFHPKTKSVKKVWEARSPPSPERGLLEFTPLPRISFTLLLPPGSSIPGLLHFSANNRGTFTDSTIRL
jgi:hypothetical protein